jgi:hypothetical protein
VTDQTQHEREAMALQLARDDGRRQERVNSRLDSLEDWRKIINGSIARGADATEKLGDKIDALAERQRIRDAVDADRLKELKKANEGQISGRQFRLGVAAIVLPILAEILVQTKVIG